MPVDEYEYDELMEKSAEELTLILKQEWGFDANESIELMGRVSEITTAYGVGIFVLVDFKSCKTGETLKYPTGNWTLRNPSVFLYKRQSTNLIDGEYVKITAGLSIKAERAKRRNPFALMALGNPVKLNKLSSAQVLDLINASLISTDEQDSYIEKWFMDYFEETFADQITQVRGELDANKEKIKEAEGKFRQIEQKYEQQTENLSKEFTEKEKNLEQSFAQKRKELEDEYDKQSRSKEEAYNELIKKIAIKEQEMAKAVEELKVYATKLLEIGLINNEQYGKLVGERKAPVRKKGKKFDGDYTKAVDHIRSYIYNTSKCFYYRDTLEDFFALISSNDLIILAGDSGSGKTSLCKEFARAVGGETHVIPVKPNWTSREDLMGYYNPLDHKYIKSEFLEALIAAENDPDRLHIICLDEMNIARVEYYFADFLSLLEKRETPPEFMLVQNEDESRPITEEIKMYADLISDLKTQQKKQDIKSFKKILEDEQLSAEIKRQYGFDGLKLVEYHGYLQKKASNLLGVKDKIALPLNVRIIGTVNVDETTYYLSPKILDRVNVIKFKSNFFSFLDSKKEIEQELDLKVKDPILFAIEDLGIRDPYPQVDETDPLVIFLRQLTEKYLTPLGIEFGWRAIRQSLNYKKEMERLFAEDNNKIINNVLLHKVFPKLMFDARTTRGGKTYLDILKDMKRFLVKELGKDHSCVLELTTLIDRAEEDNQVNYWTK